MRDLLGYDVLWASSAPEALTLINANQLDLIVSDLNMPGPSGIELLVAVRRTGSAIPFVIVTGSDADRCARAAAGLQVTAVLKKPFAIPEFRSTVARALGLRERRGRRRAGQRALWGP